jgi:outer membrane protein assembly factor BamB
MRRVAAVAVVLACLAGGVAAQTTARGPATWPMFHYSAGHVGVNHREHTLRRGNVSRLHVAWQARFHAPAQEGIVNSSVAVGKRAVFVGSERPAALFAFRRSNGKVLWRAAAGHVESSPAVVNGRIFVGSNDGHLYAFRATTGKLLWKRDVGLEVASSSPTVVRGAVYIGAQANLAGEGVLYKLSARSGAVIWQADLGAAPPGQNGFASAASVVGGMVYVGTENGQVLVFPVRCFKQCLPDTAYIAQPGAEMGTPAVNGDRIYVTGNGNDGSFVYAFARFGAGHAHPLWEGNELTPFTFSTPAVYKGLVYVQGYKLYAFGAACRRDGGVCKPRWKASVRGFAASPAVANGVVYIGSTTGRLYAFGAKCARGGRSCTPRYAGPPVKGSQPFATSPAVVGGRVYYGAFNRVRSFALR